MARTTQSCPVRRNLEKRNGSLVSRLSILAPGLIASAGVDNKIFNATTARLKETQAEITELRQQLDAHRSEHGC